MEARNFKRNEHSRKNVTKISDQGDNIKVIENVDVKQRITNNLLQADRGDSKSKHIAKSIGKEKVNSKNDNKTNRSVNNAIFQSTKGSLQLRKLKTGENLARLDNVKREKAPTEGDNSILMDADIRPFLINRDRNEVRIEKNESGKTYVKNIDNKKRVLESETKKLLNADERKKIREKYTIRAKTNPTVSLVMPDLLQNEESSKKICDGEDQRNKLADSVSESTKTVKDSDGKKSKRRPVITTIRSKNDAKVYKTVTFTDVKAEQRGAKTIQINIPTDNLVKRKEKLNIPVINSDANVSTKKEIDITTESSHNSSNKSRKKRIAQRAKREHIPSPDPFRLGESPPTEVAKWAPNCLNKHTKPYYEAWVDTTLAAISKFSKKDTMLLEKQNLVDSFRRMLERPESPELVYNQLDEKYLGKIKIRQK